MGQLEFSRKGSGEPVESFEQERDILTFVKDAVQTVSRRGQSRDGRSCRRQLQRCPQNIVSVRP